MARRSVVRSAASPARRDPSQPRPAARSPVAAAVTSSGSTSPASTRNHTPAARAGATAWWLVSAASARASARAAARSGCSVALAYCSPYQCHGVPHSAGDPRASSRAAPSSRCGRDPALLAEQGRGQRELPDRQQDVEVDGVAHERLAGARPQVEQTADVAGPPGERDVESDRDQLVAGFSDHGPGHAGAGAQGRAAVPSPVASAHQARSSRWRRRGRARRGRGRAPGRAGGRRAPARRGAGRPAPRARRACPRGPPADRTPPARRRPG